MKKLRMPGKNNLTQLTLTGDQYSILLQDGTINRHRLRKETVLFTTFKKNTSSNKAYIYRSKIEGKRVGFVDIIKRALLKRPSYT